MAAITKTWYTSYKLNLYSSGFLITASTSRIYISLTCGTHFIKAMAIPPYVLALINLFMFCTRFCYATDTLTLFQALPDGRTLVSRDGSFELGFFSPGSSRNRYLGIWYKRIPVRTVVWVANRGNPIKDNSSMLTINTEGHLVILSQNHTVVWLANSRTKALSPIAQLLGSGNLVLRDEKDQNLQNYMWQSFDHPSDTFLPGMKFGWDLRTGLNRRVIAWKSSDDPSPGDFIWELVNHNNPEGVIWKGQTKYFRTGPWNGLGFSGAPEFRNSLVFDIRFVNNKDEVYYIYNIKNVSVISKLSMNQTIYASERLTWNEEAKSWRLFGSVPGDVCDHYKLCGPFGNCIMGESPVCQCLKGFKPKSSQNWDAIYWTQGCIHSEPWSCKVKKRDDFFKFSGLKLPDTTHSWVDGSMTLEECKAKCLENCSCTAYANSDIRRGGSGCIIWFGDLNDIRQVSIGGQDLYIRSAIPETAEVKYGGRNKTKEIVIVATIVFAFVLVFIFVCIYRSKRQSIGSIAQRNMLDWSKHFQIIFGIAHGLLYLHQDSTLKIIHKDLKASNVLLDNEMNPKISDFGLARIFKGDQFKENTNKVVGTYGYMAPEYAIHGLFSAKSDVFSFGILLLETVTGMKSRLSYSEQSLNLIGHVWRLWKEGMPLRLIDACLEHSFVISEVLRCIHISLLCVQQHPDDRPNMASVVMMLNSEGDLPQPKEPAFLLERSPRGQKSSQNNHTSSSINEISFTGYAR